MEQDIDLLVLLKKAKVIQKNAYAPYSLFRVAAIVILKNSKEVLGVNVENAAYSVGICAERAALSQVIAQGYKKEDIISLFLITDSETVGSPCGMCRQFMIEIMPETCPVYISNKNENNDTKTICKILVKDLLPLAFKPSSLKGN
ncbi:MULTISPECIES: cytidine deaminase [unclassified Spiroplasma]|uniref:cytidine deaminase n=1 Tax=unclassified Spiroplasma TaxID=2637901 RepID=UPI0030D1C162